MQLIASELAHYEIFWKMFLQKGLIFSRGIYSELLSRIWNLNFFENMLLHITYVILGFNNLNKLKLRFFTEQNIFKSIFSYSVVWKNSKLRIIYREKITRKIICQNIYLQINFQIWFPKSNHTKSLKYIKNVLVHSL